MVNFHINLLTDHAGISQLDLQADKKYSQEPLSECLVWFIE